MRVLVLSAIPVALSACAAVAPRATDAGRLVASEPRIVCSEPVRHQTADGSVASAISCEAVGG